MNEISVVVPVYNGSKTISKTIETVLKQQYKPKEIIVVNDGSTDNTTEIVQKYPVKLISQKNAGPASARNTGWKSSTSAIVVFTDSDCEPRPDWLKNLISNFDSDQVGAVGGTYFTVNKQSSLARIIGYEIDYRHQKMGREIDAHGSYNLAVRRKVLEEINGFNEIYPKASGEDWDLCYKIVKKGYKIIFEPKAIVGHHHTEKLSKYLKEQSTHGYWRVKLYKDHKDKANKDSYTGSLVKIQVLLASLFIPSLILILFFPELPLVIFGLILLTTFPTARHILKQEEKLFFYTWFVETIRVFAWTHGLIKGILKFGL